MSINIKVSELNEITNNSNINQVIINCCDETRKIKVSNFLPGNIVKNNNIENLAITNDKIANNTITSNQIACCSICNCNLATNSVNNITIDNNDNFTFNNVNVTNNLCILNNINLSGSLIVSNNSRIDGRDVSADGIILDTLKNTTVPLLSTGIDNIRDSIKNGELTLSAAGIAIGTTQTFSANQSNNTCFTITVPNTNLSYIDSTRSLSSSTGNSVELPIATNTNAGLMSISCKSKLDSICCGAQVNTITSVAGKTGNITLDSNDVGLGNVTNNAQVRAINSSTIGNVPTWEGTAGNCLNNGCIVSTSLDESTDNKNLLTAKAIKDYVDVQNLNRTQPWTSDEISVTPPLPAAVGAFTAEYDVGFKPTFTVVTGLSSPVNNSTNTQLLYQDIHNKASYIPQPSITNGYSSLSAYRPLNINEEETTTFHTRDISQIGPPGVNAINYGPRDWYWDWSLAAPNSRRLLILRFYIQWDTTLQKFKIKIWDVINRNPLEESQGSAPTTPFPDVKISVIAYR